MGIAESLRKALIEQRRKNKGGRSKTKPAEVVKAKEKYLDAMGGQQPGAKRPK